MENPTKRLKRPPKEEHAADDENNKPPLSLLFLTCLPVAAESGEGPVGTILSFCDFQTLLCLRKVNQKHNQLADGEIDRTCRRALEALTTTGTREHESSTEGCHQEIKLQLGWSEKYPSRDALIDDVVERLDDMGCLEEVQEGEEERAQHLLEDTGWLDSADFDEHERLEDWRRLMIPNQEGDSEDGWNVEIHYRSPVKRLVTAKTLVEQILGLEEYVGEVKDYVRKKKANRCCGWYPEANPEVLSVRHAMMCLLWSAAQPQSLRYTSVRQRNRHTAYPSGNYTAFLFFRTLDGQMIELFGSNFYQCT